MRRGRAVTLVVVSLLLAQATAACPRTGSRPAAAVAPDSTTEGEDQSAAPVIVVVENRNHLDVIVYAAHEGGARERLGLVTSGAVGRFNLPRGAVLRGGDLQLVAHPVGTTDNYVSDRVNPLPGQRVTWTLQQGFERSSIVVQ